MAFSIETPRLRLRLRDADDAAWNLELLAEHDGGTTRTLVEARQRLDDQNRDAHDTGIGLLAVHRRREGDVIGYCGLVVGRTTLDEPELAYELFRGHTDTATRPKPRWP